jgi:Zn-dependent protease
MGSLFSALGKTMRFERNALNIGSVFGIPVKLHISLLIAVAVFAAVSGAQPWAILILAIGMFGSIALHELGHSLVARAKGGYIHEIVLYPFGGAARIANIPTRPIDEILVALAGPAVSFILAVLFQQVEWLVFLSWLNYMLFFFNLLPVFPMDGGRVLRAGLAIKHGRVSATRKAATVGKYFCGLFVLVGLFGMPFQLFGVLGPLRPNFVLAFIGGYIFFAGQQEYRMVLMENQRTHFSGHREGQLDVEVSPPPYAAGGSSTSLKDRLKNLFRS